MANYLLELGLEEIPARFMPVFLKEFRQSIEKGIAFHRLSSQSVKTYGTYRRLIVIVKGLSEAQSDIDEWIKGPPLKIAFDEQGNSLPPALGFAKKMGVNPADLVQKEGACFAKKFEKGKSVSEILPTIVSDCINNWNLPIAMRWGTHKIPFFRPLHWIVSMLDERVIPLTFWGVQASNQSYGHRMLTDNPDTNQLISGQPIQIQSVDTFINQLRTSKVEPDPETRRASIQSAIGKDPVDPALLTELIYLVEWPTVLEGQFDRAYLSIPDIALTSCMQKHQKYIPRWEDEVLSSKFWIVAESVTEENKLQIIKGNERVLKARLEDVKFFWEEDTSQPLEAFLPKLEAVIFQKGLGNIADKTKRIAGIAIEINQCLQLGIEPSIIQKMASLSKADLVSAMVIEMPELQGVIGRVYLEKQGLSHDLAKTVEQHYWPKFVGDKLPETPLADLISIADKIDTVVACFVNNLNPTGSQDPWGVRRAVLGILQIMKGKNYSLNIENLVQITYQILGQSNDSKPDCLRFIAQRFEQDLVENGIKKETVRALSKTLLSDSHRTKAWGHLIEETRATEIFKPLVETAMRVSRLAQKQTQESTVKPILFSKSIESQAYTTLETSWKALETMTIPNLEPVIVLVPILTTYFEEVLVMDKDPDIQTNRLAFLSQCHQLFSSILDWDQLSIHA